MAVRAEPARGDRVELLAAEVAGHATETRSVSAACRASLAARRRRRCRPGSSTRVPAPSTYSTTRWLYWTVMVGNRDMAASSRWLWCRVRDSVVVCRARTSGRRHDASRGTGRRADRSGPLAMRRCRRRPPALVVEGVEPPARERGCQDLSVREEEGWEVQRAVPAPRHTWPAADLAVDEGRCSGRGRATGYSPKAESGTPSSVAAPSKACQVNDAR